MDKHEEISDGTKIEPTLLIILLLCKQVCDSILESIIEEGEVNEIIQPFKEHLEASLMNSDLHYVSQAFVLANRSPRLQEAIASAMERVKGLMIQMAAKEGSNEN